MQSLSAWVLQPTADALTLHPLSGGCSPERAEERTMALLELRLLPVEPTDEMLDAAIAPYRHGNTPEFNAIYKDTVRGYWRRMLARWEIEKDAKTE